VGVEVVFKSFVKDFEKTLTKEMKARMTDACRTVQNKAVDLIRTPSGGGRLYIRGSVTHAASPPGSPPNADTGQLMQSVSYSVDKEGLEGSVGTNIDYGLILEMGTSRMLPRPWLQPALDQSADEVKKILSERVT